MSTPASPSLHVGGTPPNLIIINRAGVTSRYPHNLEKVLEQYTKVQTQKLLGSAKEILAWLIQQS